MLMYKLNNADKNGYPCFTPLWVLVVIDVELMLIMDS